MYYAVCTSEGMQCIVPLWLRDEKASPRLEIPCHVGCRRECTVPSPNTAVGTCPPVKRNGHAVPRKKYYDTSEHVGQETPVVRRWFRNPIKGHSVYRRLYSVKYVPVPRNTLTSFARFSRFAEKYTLQRDVAEVPPPFPSSRDWLPLSWSYHNTPSRSTPTTSAVRYLCLEKGNGVKTPRNDFFLFGVAPCP